MMLTQAGRRVRLAARTVGTHHAACVELIDAASGEVVWSSDLVPAGWDLTERERDARRYAARQWLRVQS